MSFCIMATHIATNYSKLHCHCCIASARSSSGFFFFGCLLWKLLRFSTLTNSIRAGTCHCILQLKRLHAARMNHSLPQQDQAADLLFFSSLLWWKLLRASTLTNSIGAAFPQLNKLFQRTNNKPGHWGGCQSLGTAQS